MIVGLHIVSIGFLGVFGDAYGGEKMAMGNAMAGSECGTGGNRSLAVEAVVVGSSLAEDSDDCLVSIARAMYGV